jgi:hypothetical protein
MDNTISRQSTGETTRWKETQTVTAGSNGSWFCAVALRIRMLPNFPSIGFLSREGQDALQKVARHAGERARIDAHRYSQRHGRTGLRRAEGVKLLAFGPT